MAFLVPLCYLTAMDNLGAIVNGARGYIYTAGTTTALQTYSNYALSSANSVPFITADSAGRFPPAYVADGTLLRFLITSADGSVTYHDHDNVLAPNQLTASSIHQTFTTQSANFSINSTHNGGVIGVDCSLGDVSVTADSNVLGNGFYFTLVKTNNGGGRVLLSANVGAGQTINGSSSSYEIDTPFEAATFSGLGGNSGWYVTSATSREEFGEIDIVEYTTSTTLALTDKGKLLKLNSAGAQNLTIPPFSSVPLVIGSRFEAVQWGAGEWTVLAGAGVTFHPPGGFIHTGVQYSGIVGTKMDTNDWWVTGDMD